MSEEYTIKGRYEPEGGYYYYDEDEYTDVIECNQKDSDEYTVYQEPNSEYRQSAGQHVDFDDYSGVEYVDYGPSTLYTTLPTLNPPRPLPTNQGPHPDCMVDSTDICVIAGTEMDNCTSESEEHLLHRMWLAAKPPARITIKTPLVSARQLEILRGQLTGELPRKSKSNFVKCDEETCAEICKYVGVLRNAKARKKYEKTKGKVVYRVQNKVSRKKF